MSKYLFISGSPRKGNTDFVLSKIFGSINEDKDMIFIRDKKIKHCVGCLSCHNKPECIMKDDMGEILNKMLNSKVIIIGTPNYFDNVTGLIKDFIDRTHPFYKSASLKGKKLILIMVGGGKVAGSAKYLNESTAGFVKYQKLDLAGSYCFEALHLNDLKQNPESQLQINKIIEKINSL